MVSIIAAVASNGVIGRDNTLIWHLPADLKRFKKLTMGHHIVMGRKTYDSIGRSLPGRTTVLITRNRDLRIEGLVADSLEMALARCGEDTEIFITGGGEIYRQALPVTNRIYLTRIHRDFKGDTYFPALNMSEWESDKPEDHLADEKNPYDYSFITLNRRVKGQQ